MVVPACLALEVNRGKKDFTEGYNSMVGMDATDPEVISTFDNDISIDSIHLKATQ